MKTAKTNIDKSSDKNQSTSKKVNPFKKLLEDKDRIANAVDNDQSLSTLKDIKFVRPL
ncbi:hypothetical protein [Mucilaginibacter rubeus]|uniref:Uncharacterized protein n=1 Tax=Mucilaginibacter rubeus TaxID=2027860 RepID=A0ABX7UM86_9SPHI|nr:hypothetical protein [Mucilaginibacter rubeus]QTE46251.1 hypothetical protein J3L19_13135 [Mucilaginibacter rubeus]QTE52848.1 hypothetical protein J3L21_13110 [Mucilaginibacter rubeus]QTE57935.1 hypothetical protein J3L23_04785 [Mucilaginibacter rubeus]QTE62604.1 hypothetical protein J3L22_29080 [Mucilaginibacter rubeus]QTF61361.1 hypothetical protein J3L20_28700 [Mucilaginibacter rubeus]